MSIDQLLQKEHLNKESLFSHLTKEELDHLKSQLTEEWAMINHHHLEKDYTFDNFQKALQFTNTIAEIAEQEGHHPDIIVSYGKVKVRIWTHTIDGLSRADFILAEKIDQLDNQRIAAMAEKALIENYMNTVWNQKDLGIIDALFAENAVIHSLLGRYHGAKSMKQAVHAWLIGFPDLSVNIIDTLVDKDKVVVQWEANGTHLGTFKGIEATERKVFYSGVTIYRVSGSKIIEYWAYLDMASLLDQISKV